MRYRVNLFIVRCIIRFFERYIIKRADIILANSQYSADLAKSKGTSEKASIVIARPGIQIRFDDIDSKYENDISEGKPINALFVGGCDERKGLIYAVESFKYMNDLDVILNVAGEFPAGNKYCRKIRKLIEDLRVIDRVRIHGFLPLGDLKKLCRSCSVLIAPSISEGYGMAIAEAMGAGLPVIATRVGGIPELIEDGINGIFVDAKNARHIADAIRFLAEHPEKWRHIHDANIEKSKSVPSWDDFCASIEKELVPSIEKVTGLESSIKSRPKGHNK